MIVSQYNVVSSQIENLDINDPNRAALQKELNNYLTYFTQIDDTIFDSGGNDEEYVFQNDWNIDKPHYMDKTAQYKSEGYTDNEINLLVFMDILRDGGSIQNAEQGVGESLDTIAQYAKNATTEESPQLLIRFNELVAKARSK